MIAGFNKKNKILYVDNISLTDIATQCGTPIYVYSSAIIQRNLHTLQEAFKAYKKQPLIAYACKANSNLSLLKLMANMNIGADVVSGGELEKALHANIQPENIVFSGVGKSFDEIKTALTHKILQINVESKQELEHIASIAKSLDTIAPVALRLNPNVDANTHIKITTGKEENKFGLLASEIKSLYQWAVEHPNLNIKGLSLHIGSQLTSIEPFRKAFQILAHLSQELISCGYSIESLDLGGGLGISYENEKIPNLDLYANIINDLISPLCNQIIIEPGRMITGNAGVLLSRVLYIKETSKRNYLILDAGMNDLIRPTLYDAFHEICPVSPKTENHIKYDIVGPICESGDTFGLERHLPVMNQGDLVAIMNCGAYGAAMASNYNTRPLPAEILVQDNKYITIRKRQSIRDIIKLEDIDETLN